jgi:hypothetical protein
MTSDERFWARLARHNKRNAFKKNDRVAYVPRPTRHFDPLNDHGTVFVVMESGMVGVRFDSGPHVTSCVPWRLKIISDQKQGDV